MDYKQTQEQANKIVPVGIPDRRDAVIAVTKAWWAADGNAGNGHCSDATHQHGIYEAYVNVWNKQIKLCKQILDIKF